MWESSFVILELVWNYFDIIVSLVSAINLHCLAIKMNLLGSFLNALLVEALANTDQRLISISYEKQLSQWYSFEFNINSICPPEKAYYSETVDQLFYSFNITRHTHCLSQTTAEMGNSVGKY